MKKRFLEYLDSKKKMKSPVIDPTGDQIDPKTSPVKPPKAKNRYKPGVSAPKTPGKGAWGDLGEKNLVYKPDLKNVNGCKPAKIPTAEQIQISNVIIASFAKDPTLIETFVRQLKNSGLFGPVVAEVFEQKETCDHLAEILTHETYGPKLCKRIASAVNEEVAKPFGDQLQDSGEEEEDEEDPFKDEEDDDEDGDGDEQDNEDDLEVSQEDPNQDPSMGGEDMSGMDPAMMGMDNSMDPAMMGMDPNMMGGDPSMMGGMNPGMGGMNPAMGMQQPPMPQPVNPMMGMMKAFQKAMMRANMRKR